MGDITLCRQGAVGIITIDYPPVNALDSHAYFTLYEIMHDFAIDDEIRVVILTGAGERAFVAGPAWFIPRRTQAYGSISAISPSR